MWIVLSAQRLSVLEIFMIIVGGFFVYTQKNSPTRKNLFPAVEKVKSMFLSCFYLHLY